MRLGSFGFILASAVCATRASGQCLNWGTSFNVNYNANLVWALQSFDDGSGRALYAGGDWPFFVTRWNGFSWSVVGSLDGDAFGFGVYDDGTGPALYAGGGFTHADAALTPGIAKWNGSTWTSVGGGLTGNPPYPPWVQALAVYDDGSGPALYVGGSFAGAQGVGSSGIVRWNGTSWSGVGGGVAGGGSGPAVVYALAVYDFGSGPALYVAGDFSSAGGIPANGVAKWNGSSWSALGAGTNNGALALAVFDHGAGPVLYVGGNFTSAGGIPALGLAKWNGTTWSALPSGVNNGVWTLSVFDDGNGSGLYAGGAFGFAGGQLVRGIARWNGASWSALGYGVTSGIVYALAVHDDGLGGGPDLYLGGDFVQAGHAIPSNHVAQWHGCAGPIDPICFGDGTVTGCPCGNQGTTAHGCQNSASTGGARLFASGSTNPDTVVMTSAAELPTSLSIFLQGSALTQTVVAFGDGIRCAGGNLKRLYLKTAVNGTAQAPQGGDPSITQQSANLGDPLAPGMIRYYQTYYRDADPSFCAAPTGSTFNASNGLRIVW